MWEMSWWVPPFEMLVIVSQKHMPRPWDLEMSLSWNTCTGWWEWAALLCLFNLLNLLRIFKLQNCLTSLRLCATKQLDQFWYYKGHKLWELSKSKHRDQESFLFSPHPFHPEGAKICACQWWEHSRMSRMIVFLCLCFCLHSPWRFWCHTGKQKLMQQGKREND